MKIHNGLPLPCKQGGTGILADTRNHKRVWREHFPFHSSICKCTFHSSCCCFNKCVCGGEPCTANPSQGKEKGAEKAGFGVWGPLRASLLSSGFHPAQAVQPLLDEGGGENKYSINMIDKQALTLFKNTLFYIGYSTSIVLAVSSDWLIYKGFCFTSLTCSYSGS